MPRPCRASIFAMVGSKLTINAQPPEPVRVRLDLRWLGSRPGRVPVNTPERFNPESVPPPDSTLPLDAAARVVARGALWALSPLARLRAIAGAAGLGGRPFRRPGRFRPASRKDLGRIPPASRQDPASVPTGRSRPSPGSAPSRGPPA